jgi:membrane-bound lytic murein transglycosylase B
MAQFKRLFGVLTAAIIFAAFPFTSSIAFGQSSTQPAVCNDPASEEIEQACKEYAIEAKKLAELQSQLNQQKAKTGALQGNVNTLISKINATQSKIKGQITAIGNLTSQIKQKSKAINDLEQELYREHASLEQLLKRTHELDQKGSAYVVLSSQSVTDFYQDLDNFLSIKRSLYASVNKVKEIKSQAEDQKEQLQDKQAQALDAKASLEHEKKQIEGSKVEAQKLLTVSQNEQKQIQAITDEQRLKVSAIESKLFSFAGGGTKAIPFKDAYAYAVEASKATGVRPAFILAILTQESNLGKNVGTCNRAGDPPSKSWVNVMHPTRDQPAFKRITSALGLNIDTTPVSCPIPGGGWGGAMGPAQFIPSTWELIQSRVASSLGKSTANPWIARDAIMASATYLKDRGGVGGEVNERNAACRYYSGRACDGKRPPNSFYGNSVMALTRAIQADIDYLKEYGVSRR